VDVLIAGGGLAGLAAALAAGRSGQRVLLLEQNAWWGGRAAVDEPEIDGTPAAYWMEQTIRALRPCRTCASASTRRSRASSTTATPWPASSSTALAPASAFGASARGRIVSAIGAIERPLAFAATTSPA
jgi:sarcosine oxidase subunit alpha